VITAAVEGVRTGRMRLGRSGVADSIPDGFYGESFLPDPVLDNAGWILAAGIAWIVVAALLMARSALRGPGIRHRGSSSPGSR
jgi:hypothetical protein